MRKINRILVLFVIVAGALAITKPSDKEFESWVKKKYAQKREKSEGENVIEKLVEKGANTATELQILATFRHTNFFAAKTEAWANGETKKFLGIAKIWIQIP